MTEEEKVKKYVKEKINDMKVGNFKVMEISHLSNGTDIYNPKVEHLLKDKIKQAYLDGLKAGKDMAEADLATIAYMQGAERYKTKWHDLRKDPNDVPNDRRYVWTNVGAGYHDDDGWWDDFGRLQNVITWCEPKFEE